MHLIHKLGQADSKTGYYTYYKDLHPLMHKETSNALWTMSNITFKMKRNIFKYRTGTLNNQIHI